MEEINLTIIKVKVKAVEAIQYHLTHRLNTL